MEDNQLHSQVTDTMREVFGEPELVITDAMQAGDVEAWDSLNHINLIVALEKNFRIRFTTGEIKNLRNVGDLLALIRRKTQ
jgi:acyl carrier protein